MAQDNVTRERLLRGNWNITYKGGMFNPDWFKIIDEEPKGIEWVRYWDRAATEPKDEEDDPDWTAGGLAGMYGGELYIKDVIRFRATPAVNELKIKTAALDDGHDVSIGYEVEPGSSGKEIGIYYQTKVLKGYTVLLDHPKGNKVERCKPWCALAEHGHVYLIKGKWNRPFLAEAGGFPFGKKDQIDSISGAYKMLTLDRYVWPRFKMSMARNFDIRWKWAINVGALYLSKDMKLSFICAVWDRSVKKLFVYGELIATQLSLSQITVQIFRGMQMERRKTFAVYGNDIMFHDDTKSTTELLNTELHTHHKQKRLRRTVVVVEPYEYDRLGAINLINLMFHEKQIVVHKSCKESARQFSSWYIEKDKPVPIGFELCEALAHIVSELNRTEKIKEPVRQMTDYPPVPMKKEEEIDNWWWQTQ
jgi:phage terminase large subunit-like protein